MNELTKQSIKPKKSFINRCVNKFEILIMTKGGEEYKTTERSTHGNNVYKTMWRKNTNFAKLTEVIYFETIVSNKRKIELQTYMFIKCINIINDVPTEDISHKLVNITVLTNDKIIKKKTVQQTNMGYQLDFRSDFNSINKILVKSELKYIDLDRVVIRKHFRFDVFKQIEQAYKYRERLEILQNLKAYDLMTSIIRSYADMRVLTKNYIKTNKQWLKRGLNITHIGDLDEVKKYYPLNESAIERLKHDSQFLPNVYLIIQMEKALGLKPHKLLRYLDRQGKTPRYYQDYLNMMRELNMDTEHWTKMFPKDLAIAHDRALQVVNEVKEMEKTKELEYLEVQYSKFKEILKKLEVTNEEYSVLVPETINSIRLEGDSLQHCVSNKQYLKKHVNLDSIILFVRKTDEIDEPYFTLEINNKCEIVQLHGFGNEGITKKGRIANKEKPRVQQFINEALKEKKYTEKFIHITKECESIRGFIDEV